MTKLLDEQGNLEILLEQDFRGFGSFWGDVANLANRLNSCMTEANKIKKEAPKRTGGGLG